MPSTQNCRPSPYVQPPASIVNPSSPPGEKDLLQTRLRTRSVVSKPLVGGVVMAPKLLQDNSLRCSSTLCVKRREPMPYNILLKNSSNPTTSEKKKIGWNYLATIHATQTTLTNFLLLLSPKLEFTRFGEAPTFEKPLSIG